MPKKLTTSQKEERAIIQKRLNEFGAEITNLVKTKYLRVNTERLKKTMNYTVKPYNVLTFSQQSYGKWNTYKDKPSRSTNANDYNPLLQEIKKAKRDLNNIIIKDLRESILYPFKNGSNTNNNQ
jgi:hypothetical protein